MKKRPGIHQSRRDFLKKGIKAGLTLPLLGYSVGSAAQKAAAGNPLYRIGTGKPLEILILGGTGFLGPHHVAAALGRGHNVSIFNRGRTKPTIHTELFSEVTRYKGFRESDLSSLKGHKWDAVIDNSGNHEDWTRDSAQLLKDSVGQYVYTSSTGVYFPYLTSNIKEDTKLVMKVPENLNSFQAIEYGFGVMKAKSELEAQKAFGKDRTTIMRPTYLMGPADSSDRFTYWPVRLSLGGKIVVPGKREDPVQFIDARDVARWTIRLIEEKTTGVFNGIGPSSAMGMHEFVHGVRSVFSAPVSYEIVDNHDFLTEHEILDQVPWIIPTGENYGSARINGEAAIASGLTLTPLAESVKDIYKWWHSDAVSEDRRIKLVSGPRSLMTREADIIKAWRSFKKS